MAVRYHVGVNGYDFRTWSYQDIGAFLQKLGMTCFELQYDMDNEQPLTDAPRILADYGVHISAIYTSSQWPMIDAATVDKAREVISECIKLAQQFGSQYVQIYPGPILGRDQYATIKQLARDLQPYLQQAADAGIILMFENLFDIKRIDPQAQDVVRRPESTLMLLEGVSSEQFKLNFDPCNFYIAGAEPWPYAYEILKGHICYVHLKDTVYFSEYLYGPRSNYIVFDDVNGEYFIVPLGDGGINFDGLLQALVQDGYDGPLLLEAVAPQDQLEASYARSMVYLRTRIAVAE